ncbi:hypothetical protein [Pseudomonas sp. NFACC04-2]|uniref:hypothetical protein n=1 Tax=Pseudomonas sp. NFACC04-2 TaxID=1566242 RepID=UPI00090917EF|nr:hypothetical protein [Pseudomonas sp. NFACC04-2]SFW78643.1 hypothetical protein SAMN03159439_04817 [Pseudomonas sp. NFACC04-2]
MREKILFWLVGYFRNIKPLSETLLGIVFAILCLLLLWGGSIAVQKLTVADCIQIVIMLFIAGTMAVGFASHSHDKKHSQSSLNLSSALSLLERAAQVIVVDGKLTNDRVAWVTCARLISRVEGIKHQLATNTHKLIFEAEHDFQRHKFRELLRPGGNDLNGAFFCGGTLEQSIGEAVMSPNHLPDGRSWIPERIIRVVYDFISFPEVYEDPLDSSEKYSNSDRNRLDRSGYEGVCDYLAFRKKFFALGNDIKQKGIKGDEPIQAEYIDSVVISEKYSFDDD